MAPSAVVTGANKGIGYHIARRLVAAGYDVVLACRNNDLAAQAADKLMAESSTPKTAAPVRTVRFDLEDTASLEAAAAAVKGLFPDGIDVVVHNAGFAFKTDATEPFHVQAEKTNRINFFNTIHAVESFLPVVRNDGRVVIIGSRAGFLKTIPGDTARAEFIRDGVTVESLKAHVQHFIALTEKDQQKAAGWPSNSYGTSKVAVGAYARLLAAEARTRDRGVTVNWCCPGWCRTDMAGDEAPRSADDGADTPAWLATSADVAGVSGKFYGERKELDWIAGSW